MTNRTRIGRFANLLTSLSEFQATTRAIWSPMISGQSSNVKPRHGFPASYRERERFDNVTGQRNPQRSQLSGRRS